MSAPVFNNTSGLIQQHSLHAIHLNQSPVLVPVYQQQSIDGTGVAYMMNHPATMMTRTPIINNNRKHAAIELYRPPSVRITNSYDDATLNSGKGKLNVHAREFVMKQNSPSSPNTFDYSNDMVNQFRSERPRSSKSSSNLSWNEDTNVQHNKPSNSKHVKVSNEYDRSFGLQRAKSSGNIIPNVNHNENKINIHRTEHSAHKGSSPKKPNVSFRASLNADNVSEPLTQNGTSPLKRSKSMSATDAMRLLNLGPKLSSATFNEYNLFPRELQPFIRQVIEESETVPDKNKMHLARVVIEYAITDRKYANAAAKLSIIAIEKDNKNCTYMDSLLNTCRMIYEENERRFLKNPEELVAFLAFLSQMYKELKRSTLQFKLIANHGTAANRLLLALICNCSSAILRMKKNHPMSDVEVVFHALTFMGLDLQSEFPDKFEHLFRIIQFTLLKGGDERNVKKMLLQLLELKMSNWQLPVSSLNYYYSVPN